MAARFAVASPAPRLRLLDRFLVLAESSGLAAVVVANKVDLVQPGPAARAGADPEEAAETLEALASYASLGYPVVRTSVKDGTGLEALRASICGRVTVFAGPSGAGKSSLLNALQPGLALRTAEVSEAVDKGRHTTVAARLIQEAAGGLEGLHDGHVVAVAGDEHDGVHLGRLVEQRHRVDGELEVARVAVHRARHVERLDTVEVERALDVADVLLPDHVNEFSTEVPLRVICRLDAFRPRLSDHDIETEREELLVTLVPGVMAIPGLEASYV